MICGCCRCQLPSDTLETDVIRVTFARVPVYRDQKIFGDIPDDTYDFLGWPDISNTRIPSNPVIFVHCVPDTDCN